jgi:threonine dehydratase
VAYAALLTDRPELRGLRIGVVLSGGNVDLERLPWTPGAAPAP